MVFRLGEPTTGEGALQTFANLCRYLVAPLGLAS